MERKTELGKYIISDKAFREIVVATLDNVKNIYPAKKDKDYVECKFNKNNELNIKISLRVKKGIDIVKLCSKIQDEVKENILLMCEVEPKTINIDIQGFENK